MARKTLENQIRQLDEQLAIEIALLKLDGRERRTALQRVPPLYWLAGSLAAGLLAGKLIGQNGPTLLISQGGNLFRLASLLMPSLAMTSNNSFE
ncbi:hypothetical protein [Pseudomonas sp. MYb185]|uniref:hypothetical protein n=1 Tax=Pseudomonas sp. MYb185 TaxID=1848729 RepID=UPI000CFD6C5F|nr:hypothetical protein [Pseudomonas sp. MYb185]PRB84296.1 hypothetical protein CQ007_00475 [Pseudomonas sp. MYb185]